MTQTSEQRGYWADRRRWEKENPGEDYHAYLRAANEDPGCFLLFVAITVVLPTLGQLL